MWTAAFWKDVVERLLWTFVEAFVAALIATSFLEIDALAAAAIAALGAVLSVLKSIAAAQLAKLNGHDAEGQTAQLGASGYTYG